MLAALSWDPFLRGWLIVLLALVLLPGTVYLLLSTNLGARLGGLIAGAALMGWLTVMALVWTVYGIGLKGPAANWVVKSTIVGNVAQSGDPQVANFPRGWKPLKLDNPEAAEAQAAADVVLAPSADSGKKGLFSSTSDYLTTGAYETGGQRYFPGWDHPPGVLAIKHRPHFLVLQVEKAIKPQVVPGQTPPKSQPDSSQPPVSVLMERNLGALRVPAAWITAGSALLFGVLVSQLHRRDKQAMARRAEGAGA